MRVHSEAQIEPLREATPARLERTGVKYLSAKALAILKKAGAKVDEDSDGQHHRDAVDVARERALDILRNYEPDPLDDDAQCELRRIVGDADRELRG